MTVFKSLDNSTCKRFLNLLEAGFLRLRWVVVKRIAVIEFIVNDIGGAVYTSDSSKHLEMFFCRRLKASLLVTNVG